MSNSIDVEHVGFRFADREILRDVSFFIPAGEARIVVGKSGSGKSILLELCAGLRRPASGVVRWDAQDLGTCTPAQLLERRRRASYIFQQHALIQNYSIYDNLALPLRYHTDLAESEIRNRIRALLDQFGLSALQRALPEALSIGQARCASVARALITEPDLFFLDEPTSSLDPVAADLVINALVELRRRRNVTLLIISHNVYIMKRMRCPVSLLHDGVLRDLHDFAIRQEEVPDIVGILRQLM